MIGKFLSGGLGREFGRQLHRRHLNLNICQLGWVGIVAINKNNNNNNKNENAESIVKPNDKFLLVVVSSRFQCCC